MIVRSQVSNGDLTRLIGVVAKARRGEPVTIGVIGGSITVGAFASKPENSYAGRLLALVAGAVSAMRISFDQCRRRRQPARWLARFARKRICCLQARPGRHRICGERLLDGCEAYEGLARQILAQPNSPALLLLFMMWQGGGNDQQRQSKIGAYYGLPMVSFRDALWPEISAGRIRWPDYIVDTVHPQ